MTNVKPGMKVWRLDFCHLDFLPAGRDVTFEF
jgi:hypothetical protein